MMKHSDNETRAANEIASAEQRPEGQFRERYRGPFFVDEFNLYRYWFSVRNVFFPTRMELNEWRISLVNTNSWQICCDRPARQIEIADQLFENRNALRSTLVLATILAQWDRDNIDQWKHDTARVAQMARFIHHEPLAQALNDIVQKIEQGSVDIGLDRDTGIARFRDQRVRPAPVTRETPSGDQLFDDTLGTSAISRILEEERERESTRARRLLRRNASGARDDAA